MTACHVFFSCVDVDKSRYKLKSAWVYWREGGGFQVLRADAQGLVFAYGSGERSSPAAYTVEFTSTVGATIKACYSEGPSPLSEDLVSPDMQEFEVPLSLDAAYSTLGPVYVSPGHTTSIRRLPWAEIRLSKRTPTVATETELTLPHDRMRRRVGVTEKVALHATEAVGDVHWSIIAGHGHGTLSSAIGVNVIFTAHDLQETATIEARDDRSRAMVQFTVSCDYLITPTRLGEIFTTASAGVLTSMTDAFNESFEAFFVDTCLRRAHFFSQAMTEVGAGGTPRAESLNYTPDRLMAVFRYFRQNPDEAQLFGRTASHPADQEAIANRAYANRNGNGDIASGDGWRFRGRGYIQVTGRANYSHVQNEIDARFPGCGVDIVADPDAATTIRGGMISAMAFWSRNGLHVAADGGATEANSNSVSRLVNPGEDPMRRWTNFRDTTQVVFHVSECPST